MSERGTLSRSIPHRACWAAVMAVRLDSTTGATNSMYGLSASISKYLPTHSRKTEGANGRKDSRYLILRLITDCILGLRASPMMLRAPRSEEHTSELQSLTNIVCRLLLEKKKTARRLSDR